MHASRFKGKPLLTRELTGPMAVFNRDAVDLCAFQKPLPMPASRGCASPTTNTMST